MRAAHTVVSKNPSKILNMKGLSVCAHLKSLNMRINGESMRMFLWCARRAHSAHSQAVLVADDTWSSADLSLPRRAFRRVTETNWRPSILNFRIR